MKNSAGTLILPVERISPLKLFPDQNNDGKYPVYQARHMLQFKGLAIFLNPNVEKYRICSLEDSITEDDIIPEFKFLCNDRFIEDQKCWFVEDNWR